MTARFSAMFAGSLKNPVLGPPWWRTKSCEIVESGTWQLRHPVGPDAEPTIAWRMAMSDEEYVDMNAADDDTWYGRMERDFGAAMRPRS